MAAEPTSVKIELQNRELWERFKEAGTEMVITKQGRRMFPVIKLTVSGLVPNCHYTLMIDFVIAKETRRKFHHATSRWMATMPADFSPIEGYYVHPGTPARGLELMESAVSFHKLKLSNRIHESSQVIALKSMHVYIPRFHVYETPSGNQGGWHHVTSFVLHQAEFVAVTSYNNSEICKLKIDNNPFAKAFRKADLNSSKRRRLDLASDRRETSSRNPASGTTHTGETPLDQSVCEESPTSGYPIESESPDCEDMMCVVIPTSGPFWREKPSEEALSFVDHSGVVAKEGMICLEDSTCIEVMREMPSVIEGHSRNVADSYNGHPGESSFESTVESGFHSGNLQKSVNGINPLEYFYCESCNRFDVRKQSGSGSCGPDPTIEVRRRCDTSERKQSSCEGDLTEKRDCESRLESVERPCNLSCRRRRRKAHPRRIQKDDLQAPGQEKSTSEQDCETISRVESGEVTGRKKDIPEREFQEIQSFPKDEFQETQDILTDNFQETRDAPEERLQEMQNVPKEQSQKTRDSLSEKTEECEEKGDLCDVMWLTSLGSVMNVDDDSSLILPGSGLEILAPAAHFQVPTSPAGDVRSFRGAPRNCCQSEPHASQIPDPVTSAASRYLAGDVTEHIPVQQQVMETSNSTMTLDVTNMDVTMTKSNQSDAGSLGHMTSAPPASTTTNEESPMPSVAQQGGQVTRDTEDLSSYVSFADAFTGPNVNWDVSERDPSISISNKQTSFPDHSVPTQIADVVTEAQIPADIPADIRRSLPNQSSVSSSWPVIVSVYSQQSPKTSQEPDVRSLTSVSPISYEGNRNQTEDITNAPQWNSSEKPWSVTYSPDTAAITTADEGDRNVIEDIANAPQDNSGPVVLGSYSLQSHIGQQHYSDSAVVQEGITEVQMSQSYDRYVLNNKRPNSCHRSARYPVALESYYSFRVGPRSRDATVARPYLSNRYYRPTRTIYSRFSLEPLCSVLPPTPSPLYSVPPPCTPALSTLYSWQEATERRFPYRS